MKRKPGERRWWRFRITWNPHVIAFADWHREQDRNRKHGEDQSGDYR
jgi:hypothetical protein